MKTTTITKGEPFGTASISNSYIFYDSIHSELMKTTTITKIQFSRKKLRSGKNVSEHPSGIIFERGNQTRPEAAQRSLRETHGKPRKPSWPKIDQNVSEYVRLGLFSVWAWPRSPEWLETLPGSPGRSKISQKRFDNVSL